MVMERGFVCSVSRRVGAAHNLVTVCFVDPTDRRFLFLVCRHVNSALDSKHSGKGGFTTPNHVHGN